MINLKKFNKKFTDTINAYLRSQQNYQKAQIKMFENVAVMIVFFFLLVLGLKVYYSYQEQSIRDEIKEIIDAETFQLIERLTALPELECSISSIEVPFCIDYLKADALKRVIENNKEKYFSLFGFSTIEFKLINGDSFMIYNNLPNKYISKEVRSFPVLMYNPIVGGRCAGVSGECILSNIKVTFYEEA